MSFLLSRTAAAYYGSTITSRPALPTWLTTATLTKAVRDVAITIEGSVEDWTPRDEALDNFGGTMQLAHRVSVVVSAHWQSGDTFMQTMIDAMRNRDRVGLAFFDQPITSANYEGVAGNFWVSLNNSQILRDVQRMEFAFSPANTVQWFRN